MIVESSVVVPILKRDIDRRIAGFARGCADPAVLAAVGG